MDDRRSPTTTAAPACRVVVADDHQIVREGIAMLLRGHPDIDVVGEARDGREALRRVRELQPDVLVLDVSMPDLDGFAVAEEVAAQCPRTGILVLTRHAEQPHLRRMLRAGARGYVVKRSASQTLVAAIREVHAGRSFIDPGLSDAFIAHAVMRGAAPGPARESRREVPLSEREEEVLRLIAWGKSNKEVAAQLAISIKTAEGYKASALAKLGLRTRTDILRHALAERWLDIETMPE